MSSNGFRCKSGTMQLSTGYPTGINKNGRSFLGRFSIFIKKFIGLGVCVNAHKPAFCIAVINIPLASPTDSFT